MDMYIEDLKFKDIMKKVKVLKQIGDNACQLELPSYTKIYLVVNVENLKLFEPLVLGNESSKMLPSVEDLVINQEMSLEEDTIIKKSTTTQ